MPARLLLVEDHQGMREALREFVDQQDDLEVVGEAEDGHAGVAMALALRPDLVLTDVAMPRMDGIEMCAQILTALPATKVIALSMHTDTVFVAAMTKAGASDYLPKSCPAAELLAAIRKVLADETCLNPL